MKWNRKKVLSAFIAAIMVMAGMEVSAEATKGEPMTKKIVQTAGRDVLGQTAPPTLPATMMTFSSEKYGTSRMHCL